MPGNMRGALLLATIAVASGPACDPELPPGSASAPVAAEARPDAAGHRILLGGSADESGAEELLARWHGWGRRHAEIFGTNAGLATSHLLHVVPAEGFPRTHREAKGDRWSLELGICRDADEAKLFRELLSYSFAYARVEAAEGPASACPRLLSERVYDEDPTDAAAAAGRVFPLRRQGGLLHWRVDDVPDRGEACAADPEAEGDLAVELLYGPNVVSSAYFAWSCAGEFPTSAGPVELGERVFVQLELDHADYTRYLLVAMRGGSPGAVLELCDFPLDGARSAGDASRLVLETGDEFRWDAERFRYEALEVFEGEEAPWACPPA